jgi:hypothetical protein
MNEKHLLSIDACINLILGLLLMLTPLGIADLLGVPTPITPFYALILGAVLLGIGLALITEIFKDRLGVSGLGLGGAVCINLCGAGVLVIWLLISGQALPLRGQLLLWSIAILVLGLSTIELLGQIHRN